LAEPGTTDRASPGVLTRRPLTAGPIAAGPIVVFGAPLPRVALLGTLSVSAPVVTVNVIVVLGSPGAAAGVTDATGTWDPCASLTAAPLACAPAATTSIAAAPDPRKRKVVARILSSRAVALTR